MTPPEVAPPDGDDPYRLNNFTAPDLQRILNKPDVPAPLRAAAEAALLKLAGGQRIKSSAEIDAEVADFAKNVFAANTDTPTPTTAAAEPPKYRYITLDDYVEERVATREQLATNYRTVRRRHLTQLAATTLAYALLAALFVWHATTDTNPWAILDWACAAIPAVGVLGGISLIRQHTHPSA